VSIIEFSNDPPIEERRANAAKAHKAFTNFCPKNVIVLPKTTAKLLGTINSQMVEIFNEFTLSARTSQRGTPTDSSQWLQLFERIRREISAAMEQLEDEFRRLLGDMAPLN
jgi:hypothetical protein